MVEPIACSADGDALLHASSKRRRNLAQARAAGDAMECVRKVSSHEQERRAGCCAPWRVVCQREQEPDAIELSCRELHIRPAGGTQAMMRDVNTHETEHNVPGLGHRKK